jgi:hypothetical protein
MISKRPFLQISKLFLDNRSAIKSIAATKPWKKTVTPYDTLLLNTLRNKHLGKRCFVIGNGPSLTVADLDRLRFEYTFAANKIYLAFSDTKWRPTYFSCEDPLVMQQNEKRISNLDRTTKLFPFHMKKLMKPDKSCYFIEFISAPTHRNSKASPDDRNFSYDLTKGIHWGSTITYSMLQMAVYMGFSEIYLLGIDHTYVVPKEMNDGHYISEGEQNHFHQDYRKPGEKWNDPRVDVLEISYRHARKACEDVGVKVFNASRTTHLDVFERIDLDDVLK